MTRTSIFLSSILPAAFVFSCSGRLELGTETGGTCNDDGTLHAKGTTWTCSDGCHTCSCANPPELTATSNFCMVGDGGADDATDLTPDGTSGDNCYVEGVAHPKGSSWRCDCNTCTCVDPPEVASTLEACIDGSPPTEVDATPPTGSPGEVLVPLTATPNGYVSPTNAVSPNTVGVNGSWYAYGDGWGTEGVNGDMGVAGERGTCELLGGFPTSECSKITAPLPPAPLFLDGGTSSDGGTAAGYANGFPSTPLGSQTFCLSGTAAQILTADGGTSPDYADIYGIGMGLDFNNVGGIEAAYNAKVNHVIGVQFAFNADGAPPPIRIEFPTTDTVATTGDPYFVMQNEGGPGFQVRILWSDLESPYPAVAGVNIPYAPPSGTTQPRFNPAHLLSIQFHLSTNVVSASVLDNMCISDLRAIVSTN